MLVFLITIVTVIGLLILDRLYPEAKEPIKYTNLDWEIIRTGPGYYPRFYGRIYSVVKNRIKVVYDTRMFDYHGDAEEFTKKIYHTMRTEYGLTDMPEKSFPSELM